MRLYMKKKAKEPPEPVERYDTIRKYMVSLLEEYSFSAKEIAAYLGIPESDVCGHLEHIKKSINKSKRRLDVISASCTKCGFVFTKREKLSKPGKCPLCHNALINPPLFSIYKSE